MSFYKETLGYVLHQKDYKNSSMIIEFFSQDCGMLHLIAKGIKNNKLLKSQIHYFSLLKIQYYGKSSLKTVTSINLIKLQKFDNIIERTAGLYLNELLHYSLSEFEQADNLYQSYQNALSKLGTIKLTPILREFELQLLKHSGFELSINSNIIDSDWIGIDEHEGVTVASIDSKKLCKNSDLKKFLSHQNLSKEERKRINKFMVQAIDMSLNFRKIYTREMLKTLTSH